MDADLQEKMKDQLTKQDIVVRDHQGAQVCLDKENYAFFALLAQDMMQIAEKYEKDIDEVHKIYYQVSCSREKLVKVLQGDDAQKNQ